MNADDQSVTCTGHQELRDIVIETRADVKHLLEGMRESQRSMTNHEDRINRLEAFEDRRVGEAKATVRNAGLIAGIIATVGTLVSIFYTIGRS